MSEKKIIMAKADCLEKLLSEKNYQDIGSNFAYLEVLDMTVEYLQETDIVRAVYRILKNCPSQILKNRAKHLLSKWRTLYRDHDHQSTQAKPVLPDHAKEGCDHLQVVREGVNSSEKVNQHEIKDTASSSRCSLSESHSKHPESSVDKCNTTHASLLGQSSQLQDHMTTVRYKCTKILYEALMNSSTNNEGSGRIHKIAEEIEQHIFALYAKNDKKYKNCIRSKVSNLKNPKNTNLKQNLCTGTLSPKTFAAMSAMEMAHDELKQLRASYTESSVLEHQLPQSINGTQTNKIKCRRCEKFDCTVTVIARGALFLPGWVRNTNPDEQMMTYVICNECGEQWYHSSWICL